MSTRQPAQHADRDGSELPLRTIEDAQGRIWGCSDPHRVTNCNGHDCNPPRRLIRDGSERRRSMEREHERGLAADVAEPGCYPDAIGSLVNAAKAEGKAQRTIADLRALLAAADEAGERRMDQSIAWMNRAEKAEAALARVEALMAHLHTDLVYVGDLRAALRDPEAAG